MSILVSMDLEQLILRAQTMQKIRHFFAGKNYLELDTPALSPSLIPETCLEVFKTDYLPPPSPSCRQAENSPKAVPLYLTPSPEIYIKKIISRYKVNVFQLSKCYRNTESIGRIHSPEFTMLEYYTMDADYLKSIDITEALFTYLLPPLPSRGAQSDPWAHLRPPFIRLTMNEAFECYAGFSLESCTRTEDLAEKACLLGLGELHKTNFSSWPLDDLYELIFVHRVEPSLPKNKAVFLMDYPAFVPCLAKDAVSPQKKPSLWKERWELYVQGIELANCYTEEINPQKVKAFFESEGNVKQKTAQVPHAIDKDYWKIFTDFPPCSGVAMGFDRLLAILAGFTSIEPVLPFLLNIG